MKNTWKWIIGAIALVALIVGASLLYDRLSDDYKGDGLVIDTPETTFESQKEETNVESESETEEIMYQFAPDFTVTDKDGNKVKLSDMRGKPVVINFWATWCGYCIAEMPDFEEAYKEYGDDITFMMINVTDTNEPIAAAKKHLADKGYTFPAYFDTEQQAAQAYYVSSLPITYFIDAEGRLIAHKLGMIDFETLEYGLSLIR